MIRVAVVVLLSIAAGCDYQPTNEQRRLACECFSEAAYSIHRAKRLAELAPAPHKCCGECGKNGLPPGKMLSGDRQKVVPCPCPDDCECKSKSCLNGKCRP